MYSPFIIEFFSLIKFFLLKISRELKLLEDRAVIEIVLMDLLFVDKVLYYIISRATCLFSHTDGRSSTHR